MKKLSLNPDEKYCPVCEQFKARDEFPDNRAKKDGKAYRCKECNKIAQVNYRKKRGSNYLAYVRGRSTEAMQIVGMDRIGYEKAWIEQCGKCAICGKEETSKHQNGVVKRLAVDHDHKTGQFRGLLCYRCNIKLHVLEDESFTSAARSYLERNPSALPE